MLNWMGVLELQAWMPGRTAGGQTAAALPGIGSPALEFSLPGLDGEQVRLSEFIGRPVVLNFWATWCSPCLTEMPEFERIYRAQQPDLVVLGVNLQESPEAIQEFTTSMGITYPILLDQDGDVSRLYKVIQLPNTYFIDRQGTIQARHIGLLSLSQIKEYLARIGNSQ